MGWVECEQQKQIVNPYMSIGVIQFLKLENLLAVAGFKHTGHQCAFLFLFLFVCLFVF